MLPKIAHYAGFQSYGDLAYPDLKAGKKELESNTIYQETVRKGDELKFYKNSDRWTTLYDENLSKGVEPVNFENPLRVTKQQVEKPLMSTNGKMIITGGTLPPQRRTFNGSFKEESTQFDQRGVDLYNRTVSSLKKESHENIDGSTHKRNASCDPNEKTQEAEQPNDFEYLQTGTEHWKSTYNASIKDPYAYTTAKRPEWTLHRAAYTVEGGPRNSNYKEHFGTRGTNPLEQLSRTARMPPVPKPQNDLALGTTKSTYHVPGYTGHIPKSLISPEKWDQAVGANTRVTYLKQNVTENYHTRIPGYAGHRPREAVNDRGSLRQFCFSTAGERFH